MAYLPVPQLTPLNLLACRDGRITQLWGSRAAIWLQHGPGPLVLALAYSWEAPGRDASLVCLTDCEPV